MASALTLASDRKPRVARNYDHIVRVVMLGDSGVGKSAILRQFTDSEFVANQIPTIGIDFSIKNIVVDDKLCKLQVWDTAGQDRYRNITKAYFRCADVVVVAFDVTDVASFRHIQAWLEDVKTYAPDGAKVIVVGNKVDLAAKRQITQETALSLTRELGVDYIECSAKSGVGIDLVFETSARRFMEGFKARAAAGFTVKKDDGKTRKPLREECCAVM
jgi:small GTP-binding protein